MERLTHKISYTPRQNRQRRLARHDSLEQAVWKGIATP